jgi:hypothetical protein
MFQEKYTVQQKDTNGNWFILGGFSSRSEAIAHALKAYDYGYATRVCQSVAPYNIVKTFWRT